MSFRFKTIIGVALIEGSLLLLLVLSAVAYLTESSEEELALRARVTAESMANLTRDAVLATDLARLDSVAKQMLESPDIVYVRIMDSERVLATAGDERALQRDFAADHRLDDIRDGVFDAGVDIVEAGFSYGRVEVGLSIGRVNALIAAARRHLSGIAVIEMLLVALFSFMLGAYLTRGLKNLSTAAKAIAAGELAMQVPVKGNDELAETGQAFNRMSVRLAESRRAMQDSIDQSAALAARLADKEQRLSTILETAVDGFVTIDQSGIIDSINAAGARLFGYEPAELVGRNVSCLMPEPDRHRHDGYLQHYIETGEARVIGRGRHVTGQRRDGSTFPMDLAISEMLLGDEHMFVGLVRDLTEKLQTEAAARKSEAMRAAIVDANLDGLVTIDANDRIVEFSPMAEEIFGYTREEAMGRCMAELIIPPEMRAMHTRGMQRYLETGEGPVIGNRIEVEAMRAGGERFPIELTVQPIEVGGTTFFTAMVRDISDRKAEEQALVDAKHQAEIASEAKSRFLAHMSHEIRSPMNAVLGSLGLLLEDDLGKDQRLYARTAEASGKVLLSLINDILDFSKIEAGHLALDSIDFNVHELAREAMDLAAFRARDKVIPVTAVVAPDVPAWLNGDMARLRQILSNLLDNALKFTEQGGVVLRIDRLRATADDLVVRFTVEDSGIGIPTDSLATLFEEFQQVDNSDSTRFGGTGLGLSICKGLANLMNGSIGADSTPGSGSRFWVDIPFHTSTRHEKQQAMYQLGLPGALVIGFDPLTGQALADLCENAGCPALIKSSQAEVGAINGDELPLIMVDGRLGGDEMDAIAQQARSNGIDRLLLIAPLGGTDLVARISRGQYDDLVLTPLVMEDLINSLQGESSSGYKPIPSMPHASATPASGVRARLLLAEDSPANQLVATAMLRKANYEVDIANNGREAIDMFHNGAYDAILMDLRMPEVDGLEATAGIRSMVRGRQVPIIAMTANAMKEDVERCLAAGMDDFVSKPVNKRRLLEILDRCLTDSPVSSKAAIDQTGPVDGVRSAPLLDLQTLQQLAVDVPPEVIPGMMQTFIDEMIARVKTISTGLEIESVALLRDEAHTLKSTAGTFGALCMHELARDLEASCRAENRSQVINLGKQLTEVLRPTLAAFQTHFDYLKINHEVENPSLSTGAR